MVPNTYRHGWVTSSLSEGAHVLYTPSLPHHDTTARGQRCASDLPDAAPPWLRAGGAPMPTWHLRLALGSWQETAQEAQAWPVHEQSPPALLNTLGGCMLRLIPYIR